MSNHKESPKIDKYFYSDCYSSSSDLSKSRFRIKSSIFNKNNLDNDLFVHEEDIENTGERNNIFKSKEKDKGKLFNFFGRQFTSLERVALEDPKFEKLFEVYSLLKSSIAS